LPADGGPTVVVVTMAGRVVVVARTAPRVTATVVVVEVEATATVGAPTTAIVVVVVVGATVATDTWPWATLVTGAWITIDSDGAAVVVVVATGVTAFDDTDEPEVPPPFVAVALNVYDVPFVSPVTVQSPDEPVTVHVKEPGVDVTRYDVGVPPEPAATVRTADASPTSAVGASGVPGTAGWGVTGSEAADDADVPPPFVAVALNVYDMPFVSPVTVQSPDEPVTVHVKEPGVDVTRYDVDVPPEPAATVTTADATPASAVGARGAPGIVGWGVTAFDAADDADVPPPFVAVVLNVYDVPFVNPVTVQLPEDALTVQVKEPGVDVTRYEAGVPPEPAATVTTADATPPTAVGAGGVPGTTGWGVTAFDALEAPDVPPPFVAVTVNVYDVPFVSPFTVQLPDTPVTVHVSESGVDVTRNDAGVPVPAATVTTADATPPTAVGAGGVPGIAGWGITAFDAVEAPDVPPPFVAVALNVYDVPLVKPATVQLPEEPVTEHVRDPGVDVTTYEVGVPPVPAATVTTAFATPATAVGAGGVPGTAGVGPPSVKQNEPQGDPVETLEQLSFPGPP